MATKIEGEWSEARQRRFIMTALRRASMRWPEKWARLEAASVGRQVNPATGRKTQHYRCEGCQREFPRGQMHADHIKPVICPVRGFVNWNEVIDRMFCPFDGFCALCQDCHQIKTDRERIQRQAMHDARPLRR